MTGWKAILAVILLDYIVAFALTGAAGFTRRIARTQTGAVLSAALLGAIFRYACHVVSGATVWAGISIPTAAALKFSFIYNATYMIPETVVLLIVALFISSSLDFSGDRLTAAKRVRGRNSGYAGVAWAVCSGAATGCPADCFASGSCPACSAAVCFAGACSGPVRAAARLRLLFSSMEYSFPLSKLNDPTRRNSAG